MHYIPIIDPGVSGNEPRGTYPPYDMGAEINVFVRNSSDQPFVGRVWNPVNTVSVRLKFGTCLLAKIVILPPIDR